MSSIIKYFKFEDPITGGTSKATGLEFHISTDEKQLVLKDGKLVVTRDESKPYVTTSYPQEDNLVEITKEEFDKLDTKDESPEYRQARKSRERKEELKSILEARKKEKEAKVKG